MKNYLSGALVAATLFSPISSAEPTEVHFWHAFTGRLGELVATQVGDFNASQTD